MSNKKGIGSEIVLFILLVIFNLYAWNTFSFILLIAYSLFIMTCYYGTTKKIIAKSKYAIIWIIMLTFSTILFSIQYEDVFERSIEILCYFLIYFAMCTIIRKKGPKRPQNFYKWFTVIILVSAMYGIYEGIIHRNILINIIRPDYYIYATGQASYRIVSLFLQPVIYGNLLVIAISYVLLKNNSIKYSKLILGIFFVALYFTKARSAWIVVVIIFALYGIKKLIIILEESEKKVSVNKVIWMFLLLVIMLIFTQTTFFNKIIVSVISRFGELGSSNSLLQRSGTMKLLLDDAFSGNPFKLFLGHGHESSYYFLLNHFVKIQGFTTTDNQWLSILYNYGLISVIIYGYIFIKAINIFLKSKELNVYLPAFIHVANCLNCFFWESYSNAMFRFLNIYILANFICSISEANINEGIIKNGMFSKRYLSSI